MEEFDLTEEEAIIYLDQEVLREEDESDMDTWQSFQDTDPEVNEDDDEDEESIDMGSPDKAEEEDDFPEKPADETPQFEPSDDFETPETFTDSEDDMEDAEYTSDTSDVSSKSDSSPDESQAALSHKYPELFNLIGKFKTELGKVSDETDMDDILDEMFPDVNVDMGDYDEGEDMEEGEDASEVDLTNLDVGPVINTDKGGGSE